MKIGAINLFNLASGRMQWLSERQKVISENVANADTAEYRAREVEDFGSYLQRSQVAGAPVGAQVVESETQWGQDLTGNNVVLEEQMLEASNASSQYKIAANLYRKAHELLYLSAGSR